MSSGESIPYSALLERCLHGDETARKALYDQFAPIAYAICLRYADQAENAKDALQEGFIKVFSHLKDFKGEGSFEGWLRRIFVNVSLEHCRKRGRLVFSEDGGTPEEEEGLNPEAYERIDFKELMKFIAALPDGYRTVFNLYVLEGWSHKDIANELGISESTSKTQLFKARRQLQVQLKHLRTD